MTVFLFLVNTANAVCLYEHPRTAEDEFATSQRIFVGKVLSETPVPESGKYYDGQDYLLEVQEIFKGDPSKTVTVFCENSSGRFPMVVGKTYLVFLYYDGRNQIDNCGNSGLVSEKQAVIKTMRLLKESENGTHK